MLAGQRFRSGLNALALVNAGKNTFCSAYESASLPLALRQGAVREIGQLFQIFGWEPVILVLGIFSLVVLSLVVILVHAAGKYKISIETKLTPLFNLRLGDP